MSAPLRNGPSNSSPVAPPKSGLTVSKIVAGAGAAATTAVVGSVFGADGTVIGAAVGSIVSAVAAAAYERSLDRTRRVVVARVRPPGGRTAEITQVIATDVTQVIPAQRPAAAARAGGPVAPVAHQAPAVCLRHGDDLLGRPARRDGRRTARGRTGPEQPEGHQRRDGAGRRPRSRLLDDGHLDGYRTRHARGELDDDAVVILEACRSACPGSDALGQPRRRCPHRPCGDVRSFSTQHRGSTGSDGLVPVVSTDLAPRPAGVVEFVEWRVQLDRLLDGFDVF